MDGRSDTGDPTSGAGLPRAAVHLHPRWSDRLANAGFAVTGLSPVVLARVLKPSADGVGTHEQLGLPPCTFLWLTGFPCPFCGMTTAWSHAAHLDAVASVRTQPMGFVFFLLTFALAVSLLYRALSGRPAIRPDRLAAAIPSGAWWSLLAGLLASWVYKSAAIHGVL